MEIHLKKNQAAELMFPMVDSATPASFISGESVTDTGYYKDGAGSWTSLAISDTVTEIGSTGMYTIELTAAEMNHDLIMITMSSTNAADTAIVIRTFAQDIDDVSDFDETTDTVANVSTVASVTNGVNITQISGSSTAADNIELDYDGTGYTKTNSTIGTVIDVTNGVTASTVSDKSDYTLSATGIDEVWDEVMDSTHTARQLMKLMRAVLGGISTGGGTTTVNFKREDDSTNAVTATVDSNGNRSAVTLNL